MANSPLTRPSLLYAALSLTTVLCIGCGGATSEVVRPAADGHWTTLPHEEWPRITLINQVTYTDKHHPVAACGFLVDTGDEVLAATAKHVLRFFKSEPMESVSFNGTLKTWKMFPKDRPAAVVVIDRLINEDPEESLKRIPAAQDWLLFTVRERHADIQPLRFRTTPLVPGETVYVVGWRYTDEGRQWIREGKLVRRDRDDGGSILISVKELADNTVPGLSGSPVIDARGHVIGLMSKKAGKLQRLAPVDYPRAVLETTSRSTYADD